MRFLKRLLQVLIVLIIIIIGVAFALPKSTHVERSISINRPPATIFGLINNLHSFISWSPWYDLDPEAKYVYSGPEGGVGAKFSWSGNQKVGSGTQEIVESVPNQRVKTSLDFGDMGKSMAALSLTPQAQATNVTWTLDSDLPLNLDGKFFFNVIGRYMGLFMDKMIGPDYEKGLAKLKTVAEALPAVDSNAVQGQVLDLAPIKIYYVTASSPIDPKSTMTVLADAYMQLGNFAKANGLKQQGALMTITTSYDAGVWKFDAAMPVDDNAAAPTGSILAGSTYAGKAAQFVHTGSYNMLPDTITKAYAWIAAQGFKPKDRLIAEYISDPGTTPVEQLKTRLSIPIE